MATQTKRSASSKRLALLLAVLGSGPAVVASPQNADAEAPKSVVVLPVDGDGSLDAGARDLLRRQLSGLLAAAGYAVIDDERADSELARAGLQSWKPSWLPSTQALAQAARRLDADGVVVLSGFRASSTQALLYADRGIEGHVSLLDARSLRVIASKAVSAKRSSGVLVDSGQIVKAIGETADNGSDQLLASLAIKAALEAAESMPAPPRRAASAAPRPKVESVDVRRGDGSSRSLHVLQAGDSIEIEARGTRGGRARASIPGLPGTFPLTEDPATGVYRRRVRIEAGSGEGAGAVVVSIYDAAGRASEPRTSDSAWRLAAPRIDRSSSGVAVAIVPAPSGRR